MRHYSILRLLLAGFMLYFAWPAVLDATAPLENWFWGSWLVFLMLVIGGNLATLLHISKAPVMEQKDLEKRRSIE